MNNRLTGQFIPGTSPLHRLDARAKLSSFILLIVAVILTNSLYGYIAVLCFVAFLIAVSGMSFKTAIGSVRRMFWFFVLIFIMNALFFSSENAIWHWWIFTLSEEGIIQGFNVLFRILIILIISNVFTLVTPPLEITSAIKALLKPIKLFRLPADEIAMIISVAIQFIPTLLEESDTIKKAQIARGARFESKKLHERAAAMLPLIVPMFLSAFKRADELSMAMEARGYRGEKFRSHRKSGAMTVKSWLAIIICIGLCVVEILI